MVRGSLALGNIGEILNQITTKIFFLMLTLAQEFELTRIKKDIPKLSKEQSNAYLLEAIRLLLVKDNMVKQIIKEMLL